MFLIPLLAFSTYFGSPNEIEEIWGFDDSTLEASGDDGYFTSVVAAAASLAFMLISFIVDDETSCLSYNA